MAISKRLRYEVLRRDGFTCRYCGEAAPQVKLTVDHVLPTALGGSDDAENLTACCGPCNSGKSATVPSQPTVAQVSEDAIRWARAVKMAAETMEGNQRAAAQYRDAVCDVFVSVLPAEYLPDDWTKSVEVFRQRGLPWTILENCIDIALGQMSIPPRRVWSYAMGIAWNKLREMESLASSIRQSMP